MEVWKDVKNWEGAYQVSNLGRIKRLAVGNMVKERVKIPVLGNQGYLLVNFSKKKKLHQRSVHRTVAQAFLPNPENKPQVNHINAIKIDNRVENLEWCTQSENMRHAALLGLTTQGERNFKSKLTQEQVLTIRSSPLTHRELATEYDVTRELVSMIRRRVLWKHI